MNQSTNSEGSMGVPRSLPNGRRRVREKVRVQPKRPSAQRDLIKKLTETKRKRRTSTKSVFNITTTSAELTISKKTEIDVNTPGVWRTYLPYELKPLPKVEYCPVNKHYFYMGKKSDGTEEFKVVKSILKHNNYSNNSSILY